MYTALAYYGKHKSTFDERLRQRGGINDGKNSLDNDDQPRDERLPSAVYVYDEERSRSPSVVYAYDEDMSDQFLYYTTYEDDGGVLPKRPSSVTYVHDD